MNRINTPSQQQKRGRKVSTHLNINLKCVHDLRTVAESVELRFPRLELEKPGNDLSN